MQGGMGNDVYVVDDIGDSIIEVEWGTNDTVFSSVDFALSNYVENLILSEGASSGKGNALGNLIKGNAKTNLLEGGDGNDLIYTNGGGDTVIGGLGNDNIWLNTGQDTVKINTGDSVFNSLDVIHNFTLGDGVSNQEADQLDLSSTLCKAVWEMMSMLSMTLVIRLSK